MKRACGQPKRRFISLLRILEKDLIRRWQSEAMDLALSACENDLHWSADSLQSNRGPRLEPRFTHGYPSALNIGRRQAINRAVVRLPKTIDSVDKVRADFSGVTRPVVIAVRSGKP